LLDFTLSYLMLTPWYYTKSSNLFSRTLPMSNLFFICLSSYSRFVLFLHYELMSLWASVGYVQTISNDVARASPQLVPPLVSRVCHRSEPNLFLCAINPCSMRISAMLSCWTCHLSVGQHSATYNMTCWISVL
jgi:hypothetical protein